MEALENISQKLNSIMFENFVYNNEFEFLFHYTDLDSVKSIIEKGQFWVSDAFTTNDKNEIIHVKKIIDELINKKYSNIETEKKEIYSFAFDTACDRIKANAFILCFSLIKDSKSLWNNYAKKNDKTGVCLRFDFSKITPNPLSELISQERDFVDHNGEDVKVQLLVLNHYVTYDNNEKRIKIEEYLDLVTEVLTRIEIDNFDEALYKNELELLVEVFTDILLYSFFSKNSTWRDEKEFRMLFIFPDIDKHKSIFRSRVRGKQEIKYVSLNMKSDNTFSLNRIFVGSKKDIKKVKRELKSFINDDIKIKTI